MLEWSKAVNRSIEEIVHNVPPFPYVRPCLEAMVAQADVLVVSATPHEALQREWDEHDLTKYVVAICGQEVGTKKECLQAARHYPPCHTLMIGDAPGDHKAAVANEALFFPINPGAEEASWKRLLDEGLQRFFDGTFRRQVPGRAACRIRSLPARVAALEDQMTIAQGVYCYARQV